MSSSGQAPSSTGFSAHPQRQDDVHPLQTMSSSQQHLPPHQQSQDSAETIQDEKVKKRNLNPAKAVIGGVSQGAQAVRGGFSQVEKGVTNVGNKLGKVPGVSHGKSFFADYRKFMDRGNVIDLAVAVVIGAAFTAIVTSLVNDIITPVIALASGKNLEENFIILKRSNNATYPADYVFPTRLLAKDAGNITWNWGNFVQTIINFFIVSACVFIIVKVYQMSRDTATAVTEKKCDYCLKDIPLDSVRCPNCTTWLDWDACAKTMNLKGAAASSSITTAVSSPMPGTSPFVDYPSMPQPTTPLGRF
ncbi:hypothetical protein BGW38_003510 [Lunasporangiospora selenospora]|uniref:Large-conductance mechanosensitive channel n=1 Tax=Lunasporangiospora selenospora TaxID=979761 RepID=A0A9P6FSN0_9FUNG|nr:hypothetical protein BGW38_003510 [Lunasporangiospora selenospora]